MNKSLLSKLMAREDLKVIESNFETASFDPKNRILRLPLLKEEFNDAAALYIGHEIGHALYTPDCFSHDPENADLEDISDIPFSILNIVEDVRIERMVREFYPGLVNDFIKGYKQLVEEGFFGIENIEDLNTLKFLDRINIKAKLNNSVSIDFSLKESLIFEKVKSTKTFEDVIEVSRDIMNFIKDEDDSSNSKKEDNSNSPSSEISNNSAKDDENAEDGDEAGLEDGDDHEDGRDETHLEVVTATQERHCRHKDDDDNEDG